MKVVSPYRPFAPESAPHRLLGAFDWIGALEMLRISVAQACHCETWAITDYDTTLAVPSLHYATTERRLMLWMLDVAGRYLASDDFDEDTVMICPDLLVYGDLTPYFQGDLGLLVRGAKFAQRPILNSVQWWRVDAKDRLVRFMAEALAIARDLPEDMIQWGADSEPLRQLLDPILAGTIAPRHGVDVAMLRCEEIVHPLTSREQIQLTRGQAVLPPPRPITDFKYQRKTYMRAYFDATIGAGAAR